MDLHPSAKLDHTRNLNLFSLITKGCDIRLISLLKAFVMQAITSVSEAKTVLSEVIYSKRRYCLVAFQQETLEIKKVRKYTCMYIYQTTENVSSFFPPSVVPTIHNK